MYSEACKSELTKCHNQYHPQTLFLKFLIIILVLKNILCLLKIVIKIYLPDMRI